MKRWTAKSCFKVVLAILSPSLLALPYTAAKTTRQYGRDKALFEAVLRKDARSVDVLLSQGASPEATNQSFILNPVRNLTMLAHRTPQNATLCSVLSYAVCEDDVEIARLLLDRGANINRRKGDSETPLLSYASSMDERSETEPQQARQEFAMFRYLLDNGADVNAATTNGGTVLMYAADKDRIDLMRLLVEKGANINAGDGGVGGTALIIAANRGRLEAVWFLIAHDAKIDSRNKKGQTALQVAQSRGYTAVTSLLKKSGAK